MEKRQSLQKIGNPQHMQINLTREISIHIAIITREGDYMYIYLCLSSIHYFHHKSITQQLLIKYNLQFKHKVMID